MTKKHFEALAATLRHTQPYCDQNDGAEMLQWITDTSSVADVCARFNPHFDRARFLAACGVEAK